MSEPTPPTMYWHEEGCPCAGCQQGRLRRYGGRGGGRSVFWVIGIILVSLVLLGAVVSFYDPYLNFPVVSQVVCSLKGDTWYGGGLLGSPGCYAPS